MCIVMPLMDIGKACEGTHEAFKGVSNGWSGGQQYLEYYSFVVGLSVVVFDEVMRVLGGGDGDPL